MMVGTVNLVEYLELAYWLKRVNYKGWLTLDIFPYREDGVPRRRRMPRVDGGLFQGR